MNKLLSCRFNMDTNRVEARFEDGTTLAIACIAVEAAVQLALGVCADGAGRGDGALSLPQLQPR